MCLTHNRCRIDAGRRIRKDQPGSFGSACGLDPVRDIRSVQLTRGGGYGTRPVVLQRSIELYANVINGDDYDRDRYPERLFGGLLGAVFTNISGSVTPINARNVDLTRLAFAQCASFPCTASGGFQDRNRAVFRATYTVVPTTVPEPGYSLLVSILLMANRFRTARSAGLAPGSSFSTLPAQRTVAERFNLCSALDSWRRLDAQYTLRCYPR